MQLSGSMLSWALFIGLHRGLQSPLMSYDARRIQTWCCVVNSWNGVQPANTSFTWVISSCMLCCSKPPKHTTNFDGLFQVILKPPPSRVDASTLFWRSHRGSWFRKTEDGRRLQAYHRQHHLEIFLFRRRFRNKFAPCFYQFGRHNEKVKYHLLPPPSSFDHSID